MELSEDGEEPAVKNVPEPEKMEYKIGNMKAPVTLFREPKATTRVRDLDKSHEKALYRQIILNPQNHIHRYAFMINITINEEWQPSIQDPNGKEEQEKLKNELEEIMKLARQNSTQIQQLIQN